MLEAVHKYDPVFTMLPANYSCLAVLVSRNGSSVEVMMAVGKEDSRIGGSPLSRILNGGLDSGGWRSTYLVSGSSPI